MWQKYAGVVLRTVKHSDKSDIVHIYTEQAGRLSFLIPAQRSRRSAVRSVLFRPLSVVEFESDVRPRSSLHPVREAVSRCLFTSLPYDPCKSAIALFLAEFLERALREETQNVPLFSYLVHSVCWLDACAEGFANFHLVFLMRLSRFLGLYPNTEHYAGGCWFDLANACFVPVRPLRGPALPPEEASRIRTLMRMNYDTMHLFAMSRAQRNRCLEVICEYYRLHLPDFSELRSLPVLQELF